MSLGNATPGELEVNYRHDGVIRVPRLFSAEKVAELRNRLDEYVRTHLPTLPPGDRVLEADGKAVRNLWRIDQHDPSFIAATCTPELLQMVGRLVNGEPVLSGIETFNKPARIGSGVPYHQDNAYFCRTPPDVLTVWIAMDAATLDNGPVYYVQGSHTQGVLPTRKSGVAGNSMGMANEPQVPLAEQFCGTLEPGDALIHHCQTIHHSAPNKSEHSRLGLLLVFYGKHTEIDPALQAVYSSPT